MFLFVSKYPKSVYPKKAGIELTPPPCFLQKCVSQRKGETLVFCDF